MPCCSVCKAWSRASFSSCVSHTASFGLSSTSLHQQNAQRMAGTPSQMNIHRQPREFIKYPDRIDIQRMVAGLPKIKKVLARERSALMNHLLSNNNMAGNT